MPGTHPISIEMHVGGWVPAYDSKGLGQTITNRRNGASRFDLEFQGRKNATSL